MGERIYCRLKVGFLVLLFFLPIVASVWNQRELQRLEAINRYDPLPAWPYVSADEPLASDLP